MSMREYFEQEFTFNVFGVVTGTAGVNQFPDVPSSIVQFKARSDNIGSFFINEESGTTAEIPYEIDGGEEVAWFAISNLNKLWHTNPSGTSDLLAYWVQR